MPKGLNLKKFGELVSIPFSCANALLASIVLHSTLVVSNVAFGGNNGKLLYGVFLLKSFILNKGNNYVHSFNKGKYI
jgi:hypothetical protein